MESEPSAAGPETPPETPPYPRSTLMARMGNVFTAPGEVFEELRETRHVVTNWLVPLVLAAAVGFAGVLVTFSREELVQQVREQQEQAVEQKLAQMPEAQRERARAAIEQFSSVGVMRWVAGAGVVISTTGSLFLIAALLWAVGRLGFRASLSYGKVLEMCGLALLVAALGEVLRALLMVGTGKLHASPGPVLALAEFDPGNAVHLGLAALNVTTLWYLVVLAIGLARLSRMPVRTALLWILLPWLVFRLGLAWIQAGATGSPG